MDIQELIHSLQTSKTSETFYEALAAHVANLSPEDLFSQEHEELSSFLDRTRMQESVSVRNVLKARALATILIADNGEMRLDLLPQVIENMKNSLYSLAKDRHHDIPRDLHILEALERLHTDKELVRSIKNMTRPVANRLAEELIRDSLRLSHAQVVTDSHVRRAVLMAYFTYLRQSLGSCFASAPAIMVQSEYPMLLLRDLDEMMNTGRLKRTFGGVEYSVPISATWGNGDLKRPVLITKEKDEVWQAPGLVAAFESVGLVSATAPLGEKQQEVKSLLSKSWGLMHEKGDEIVTTAEELISIGLLHHYGLTHQAMYEYLHKPQGMVTGGIMMHVPKTSKLGATKGDPCVLYLKDFEIAKNAFKALADCALLKAWEFTIASFSEIKLDFARFNLYTSLGVNYQDAGGIGECLYNIISKKVEQANAAMQELQEQYDMMMGNIRYLETRLRQANTESEIEWVKTEYQSRRSELYHVEALRNDAHAKAHKIANLYETLISIYDQKFVDYFQEVYDADIHDIAQGPFDDSPAGFRLLYKHGRSNPSQWTRIFSRQEFTEALVSFFTITEAEIIALDELQGIENEVNYAITELVNHVRSDAFLESALFRMARAHQSRIVEHPLEHLEEVEKKPWVYTSGGSMSTLVSAYFRRSDKPTESDRWIESENELLAFVLDSLKSVSSKEASRYLDNSNRSMLMHSPTHAFLLKPGISPLVTGWRADTYPYTWIKKEFVEPTTHMLKSIYLEEEEALAIIERLTQRVHPNFRPRFKELFAHVPYRTQLSEFRSYVLNTVSSDRGMHMQHVCALAADDVDEVLFEMAPFTPSNKLRTLLQNIAAELMQDAQLTQKFLEQVELVVQAPFIRQSLSARAVYDLVLALIIATVQTTRVRESYHVRAVALLRTANALLPEPLFFADTNWVKDYFAFVVHPVSEQVELWSVDYLGISGRPISAWKMWVNGARRSPEWGVFTKPNEYTGDTR